MRHGDHCAALRQGVNLTLRIPEEHDTEPGPTQGTHASLNKCRSIDIVEAACAMAIIVQPFNES